MSKYGGSEKTTQAFVAAYNKPRLSTRSTQAEAPAGVFLCSGRMKPLPHSPPPSGSLASSGPEGDVGWGYWEDSPLLDVTGPSPPHWPFAGLHRTLAQQIELSVPFDPVSCTTACSFMVCTGSPAPPFFSSFLATNHRDRIRHFKGW